MMQALGICLVAMAVISVAIFEFVIKGGIKTMMQSGHVTATKGEESETLLTIQYRGAGWIDTDLTKVETEAGQRMRIESLSEGNNKNKIRLRFLGKYAGRTEGVKLMITLTDPLNLENRLEEVVHEAFVLDTLPVSLFASTVPKQQRVYGFGEQPTGYSGAGQELYGLEEYNAETDIKNIIWRRVAKSPNESLIASVREASVRDVVNVGVVQFAERGGGEGEVAWIDQLCEALGQVGREVLAMGPSVTINFNSPRRAEEVMGTEEGSRKGTGEKEEEENEEGEDEEERSPGMTSLRATDVIDLSEAVMSCSVASPSRDIRQVVANSDLVVTGLKELEDPEIAMLIAQKPLLVIPEEEGAFVSPRLMERAVIWSEEEEEESLLPTLRRIVGS
jgi:ribosomal protein L12E/L44/L45/RPP1/RPP2